MNTDSEKKRDQSFDLLRIGGIIYIVGYYHIQSFWMIHLPGHLDGWIARVALALFCFISGYLLASANALTDWSSVQNFYARRFLRVYPLYLLALLGFWGAGLIPHGLLLPSALLINTIINWNLLTLWFVSMIFLFYFITPWYLYRPSFCKTFGVTVVILLILTLLKLGQHGIDPRLFPNFLAFAFGILLTQTATLRNILLTPSKTTVFVSGLTTSLLVFKTLDILPEDQYVVIQLLIVAWFIATLPLLVATARRIARMLPKSLIQFFATASFTLYLFHRLIYYWGADFGPTVRGWPQTAYYGLILLPISLLLAYFIQTMYEQLIIRISQRKVVPPNC